MVSYVKSYIYIRNIIILIYIEIYIAIYLRVFFPAFFLPATSLPLHRSNFRVPKSTGYSENWSFSTTGWAHHQQAFPRTWIFAGIFSLNLKNLNEKGGKLIHVEAIRLERVVLCGQNKGEISTNLPKSIIGESGSNFFHDSLTFQRSMLQWTDGQSQIFHQEQVGARRFHRHVAQQHLTQQWDVFKDKILSTFMNPSCLRIPTLWFLFLFILIWLWIYEASFSAWSQPQYGFFHFVFSTSNLWCPFSHPDSPPESPRCHLPQIDGFPVFQISKVTMKQRCYVNLTILIRFQNGFEFGEGFPSKIGINTAFVYWMHSCLVATLNGSWKGVFFSVMVPSN